MFRLHFAAGFFGVENYLTDYHQLIQIEESGFNSTLAPFYACANAENAIGRLGSMKASNWTAIYTVPTIKRLSQYLQGVNLTASDINAMQQLCAYEVSRHLCARSRAGTH